MELPYIKPIRRQDLNNGDHPINSGELNYVITRTIIEYVRNNGRSYNTFNDIIGALEGAKLEFARRVIAEYEDKKIEENGDVY